MDRTRVIFILILFLAMAFIAAFFSFSNYITKPTPIVGVIGSEKSAFFADERVQDILRENGFELTIQKAGSRQIATSYNLCEYDFAFPAGVPAAEKIRQETNATCPGQTYDPFFTPMVIASWQPVADILVTQGIATSQNGYYFIDSEKFLDMVRQDRRWSDIPGEHIFANVDKTILITTTDIRKSNSAAMYLALSSYVANENNIVESIAEAQPIMPLLNDLFLRQGLRPNSTQEPFEDYLVKGMGHSPLVMIYESQYIAQEGLNPGSILPEMVLMYPQPTIFTKHTFIGFTPESQQLGELLETDPELQKLAIEYGLRNNNLTYFKAYTQQKNILLPDVLVDVIDPPNYEVLEGMIQTIEANYAAGAN